MSLVFIEVIEFDERGGNGIVDQCGVVHCKCNRVHRRNHQVKSGRKRQKKDLSFGFDRASRLDKLYFTFELIQRWKQLLIYFEGGINLIYLIQRKRRVK